MLQVIFQNVLSLFKRDAAQSGSPRLHPCHKDGFVHYIHNSYLCMTAAEHYDDGNDRDYYNKDDDDDDVTTSRR